MKYVKFTGECPTCKAEVKDLIKAREGTPDHVIPQEIPSDCPLCGEVFIVQRSSEPMTPLEIAELEACGEEPGAHE